MVSQQNVRISSMTPQKENPLDRSLVLCQNSVFISQHFFIESSQLPSGYVKIAIEHGPVEIVNCPMKNGGSFHSFLYVYQRVKCSTSRVSSPHVFLIEQLAKRDLHRSQFTKSCRVEGLLQGPRRHRLCHPRRWHWPPAQRNAKTDVCSVHLGLYHHGILKWISYES